MPIAFRLTLMLAFVLAAAAPAAAQYDYNGQPINYATAATSDPVARLNKKIVAGKVTLDRHHEVGYLPAVLKELNIAQSSQVMVFTKTSLQRQVISPKTPRAIYFDDETYIGYCQDGEVLEVATTDPNLGTVFYTLDQHAKSPRFVREGDNCTQCHAGSATRDIPGLMVRSVFPDPRGNPILNAGTKLTTHESPFGQRFGGWYVSGTHGGHDRQPHLGNRIGKDRDDATCADPAAAADVTDLSKFFDTSFYLTPHSDIVALTVLAHQAEAHNLMNRANYAAAYALRDARVMNEALGRPGGEMSESTLRRINSPAEALLRYMLFSDEAKLEAPLAGTTDFAKEFAARGPRDSKGRSLREFDLKTRTFKYPLSYLIYSKGFDGLPDLTRAYVYKRLKEVLTGKDQDKAFA
ncbi:MAG TPA: hypothetical protein VF796_30045, partial [Humisphaera sp.]